MSTMKAIFGLGNPGTRYAGIRHNVGAMLVASWVKARGGSFSEKPRFKAHIAELIVAGEKVIAVLPNTYYNTAGEAYRAIIDFYHLEPENTVVIADDLALPLGAMRTRHGGRDAGNNGIKSIIAHGGSSSYRIRVGIGSDDPRRAGDSDYVLGRLSTPEQHAIEQFQARIDDVIEKFAATGSLEATTYTLPRETSD